MPARKKPTMKEMEKVTSNIIHDLKILNQKIDASLFGTRCLIDFLGKRDKFGEWMKEMQEKRKKEQNERNKSTKASTEANSKQSTK